MNFARPLFAGARPLFAGENKFAFLNTHDCLFTPCVITPGQNTGSDKKACATRRSGSFYGGFQHGANRTWCLPRRCVALVALPAPCTVQQKTSRVALVLVHCGGPGAVRRLHSGVPLELLDFVLCRGCICVRSYHCLPLRVVILTAMGLVGAAYACVRQTDACRLTHARRGLHLQMCL